jgi:hypothetical protein
MDFKAIMEEYNDFERKMHELLARVKKKS